MNTGSLCPRNHCARHFRLGLAHLNQYLEITGLLLTGCSWPAGYACTADGQFEKLIFTAE
jgi:hypothetical protein